MFRRSLGITLAAALWGATTVARAQAPDEATRLANEGKKLLAQGKVEEACASLEASERARADAAVSLLRARCLERAKNLPAAYEVYARLADDPSAPVPVKLAGQAGTKALEKKIARLTVEGPKSPPGARVRVGGREVGAGPVALEPGSVRVEARAAEHKPWSREVTIGAGESQTVTIPPLEPDLIQPLAADGDELSRLKEAHGAEWEPGFGFVRSADDAGVPGELPRERAAPVGAAPSLGHEPLHRFQLYGVLGWASIEGADSLDTRISIGTEHKKRHSPASVWWRADFGPILVFSGAGDDGEPAEPEEQGLSPAEALRAAQGEDTQDATLILAPTIRVGADFRGALLGPAASWFALGPFLGAHATVAVDAGADVGPEVGWLHLALFSPEGEHRFSLVRLDGLLSSRFGLETSATILEGRFTIGTADGFRAGVEAEHRLARGDENGLDLGGRFPLESRVGLVLGSAN